jgi:hypothetical protein
MTGRKPRIIFNDDNWITLRREVPLPHTPDKVGLAIEHLRRTQVDWLCWSMNSGGVAFSWPSRVMENIFDPFDPSARDASAARASYDDFASLDKANPENLMLSLHFQGIDYLPLLIEQCRQSDIAFIASFRMNDLHHKSRPEGKLAGNFWRDHQAYRLWEVTDDFTYHNAALNYGIPVVRNRMLAVIGEVLERYDVDGIELDWTRSPNALPPSQAWAQRRVMTRFTQRVRAMIDHAAQRRSRRIQFVLRAPHDGVRLRRAGLDVWTWICRQLVDVVATSCLVNDYDADLTEWRDLCRQHNVWYYHSVEAGPATNDRGNHVVKESAEETILRMRAAAQNILAQDTDGVYLFNYTCKLKGSTRKHSPETFAQQVAILSEIGGVDTLHATPKQYTYWQSLPIQLESWRPPQYHQTIHFHVRDADLVDGVCSATLRFRQVAEKNPHAVDPPEPPQALPEGWVVYYLNGRPLDPQRIERTRQPAETIVSGYTLRPHEAIEIQVAPGELVAGENTLAFHIPKAPESNDPYVYIYELTVETREGVAESAVLENCEPAVLVHC